MGSLGTQETGLRSVVQPGVARTVLARRGEDVLPLALSFYGGVASELLWFRGLGVRVQGLGAGLEK